MWKRTCPPSSLIDSLPKVATVVIPGDADAESEVDELKGADLASLTVGGVGSVTGQATFDGSASAETVVGDSDADSQLDASTGLDAGTIGVSSDAGLTGLSNITNIASAQSTSGGNADAEAKTDDLQGADLETTTIGGIGTLGGQSTSNTAAQAANVTGDADAESETDLSTGLDAFSTSISSDATLQGITDITSSAAATTALDCCVPTLRTEHALPAARETGRLPPMLQSASWGSLACQLSACVRAGPRGALTFMDLFLWVLEIGGVSIALIGMQRERWLEQRRR